MVATEGVGAATVGLTAPRVTVCPAVAGEAVATTAAVVMVVVVVVVEGCWVTAVVVVVVVMAAAVVVVVVVVVVVAGGVTTLAAGATALMTELTPLGWLEITVLDWQSTVLEAPVFVLALSWLPCEDEDDNDDGEVTGPARDEPSCCWAKADTLVPVPFWAILAMM